MENPENEAKTIVVLDLDDTLINTRLLKKLRFEALEKAGFVKHHIEAAYENIIGGYSTKKHAEVLQVLQPDVSYDPVQDEEHLTVDLLFHDTIDFLDAIKQCTRILLSHGDPEFQMTKLTRLDLKKFFDEIWITPNDKAGFLEKKFQASQPFIFINDKVSENDAIQKYFPNAQCYLIDRHTNASTSLHHDLLQIQKDAGL